MMASSHLESFNKLSSGVLPEKQSYNGISAITPSRLYNSILPTGFFLFSLSV